MRRHWVPKAGAILAMAAVSGLWWTSTVRASDHDEAPLVKQDAAMDITDLYVFDSDDETTTFIVCWAGFNDSRPQPDAEGVYDEDALYAVHIDNDGDNQADHVIYWRYGRNADGDVGVRFEGVPGGDANAVGAVETVFESGSARLWSGHADDPFFFDAAGYLETIDTGALSITNDRDFLAGLNVTAAAIEVKTGEIVDGENPIQVWVTSSRKGGG